jgi:hypothetical protein
MAQATVANTATTAIWTVKPFDTEAIDIDIDMLNQRLADTAGFTYNHLTGNFYNANGERTTETNVGFVAFYKGIDEFDLTSVDMVSGWQDAFGMECYHSEMCREEMDQQRNGWM